MGNHGQTPTRKCVDCGLFSDDLSLFTKSKVSKYGRRNLCLKCTIIRNEAHPKNSTWKTDHQVRKRYSVSLEEYTAAMASSDKCEICERKHNLCYDHDHVTMKFRGVLCRACNSALGHLGDSKQSVLKVLEYLSKGEEEC